MDTEVSVPVRTVRVRVFNVFCLVLYVVCFLKLVCIVLAQEEEEF